MRYLHTMVRVSDLDSALDFYCAKLGLREIRRLENEKGRFTLVFLATPEDQNRSADDCPMVELTWNWDTEAYGGGRNFGHLAYAVPDIYALCEKLTAAGVTINGLVILSDRPMAWNPEHTNPAGGLDNYYRNNVTGGPGSFVMVAENHNSFGQAIVKKMIAEIAWVEPERPVIMR